jgi:hypothetical protein
MHVFTHRHSKYTTPPQGERKNIYIYSLNALVAAVARLVYAGSKPACRRAKVRCSILLSDRTVYCAGLQPERTSFAIVQATNSTDTFSAGDHASSTQPPSSGPPAAGGDHRTGAGRPLSTTPPGDAHNMSSWSAQAYLSCLCCPDSKY